MYWRSPKFSTAKRLSYLKQSNVQPTGITRTPFSRAVTAELMVVKRLAEDSPAKVMEFDIRCIGDLRNLALPNV